MRDLLMKMLNPLRGYGLRKFRLIRWLLSLTNPRRVTVNGYRLYVDPYDAVITRGVSRGSYEPFETRLIQMLVKPGQTVLDIGANIGYYTVLLSRLVGPHGKVLAYEPYDRMFAFLTKNLAANGCDNVEPYQFALSNEERNSQLFLNDYNHGDNRLYEIKGMRPVQVRTVRFDAHQPELHVDLIKMDIQGSEAIALEGMAALFSRSHPILITEFWPLGIRRSGRKAEGFLHSLATMKYTFFEINESSHTIERRECSDLLQGYPDSGERFTNIICLPPTVAVGEFMETVHKLSLP